MVLISCYAFWFTFTRGQDINWDLQNYYYYAGYSALYSRYAIDIAVSGFQSFFNPLINIFAYVSLTYFPFPFSAWSITLLQLLAFHQYSLLPDQLEKKWATPGTL